MSDFHFYHPIEVRYGDLDPQGHVNNAKFVTYIEQARVKFVHYLGLWSGKSFLDIGFILADTHISYLQPILFGEDVRVGVRFVRLGNKSLKMEYRVENGETGQVYATAETIQVTYDYREKRTIPIPDHWRRVIADFDNLDLLE
jgi:acyl-CoA thioester hydrolase